jgi:hypothetical protein
MSDESVFAAALEKTDPADRAEYLAAACAGAPDLRKRVEDLLAAHDAAGAFLENPPAPPTNPDDTPIRTFDSNDPDDPDDALAFLAPPRRPDSLGRIGHYEVLEVLGRGGFGIVFRAFDDVLQRVVAVKVLAPQMAATSPARKRFLREARASAQIRHEHVVQVYEVGDQPLPFLVMEYIPGETLQQRLDRTGPLDVPETVRIARQVADGLAAAHAQGLVHRDVKPGNVLIESGPQGRVKLTDFGLARAVDDASVSQSGVVVGTPMYMSPEQARGASLDHRTDLFSLGSVLYVMVTGHPPFRANSTPAVLKRVCEDTPRPIREIIPEVPEWLCRIIEKLHAKNPADRFQSAREVADLFANCEDQLRECGTVRDLTRIPGGKSVHPPTRLVAVVAVGVCLIAALFWGAIWLAEAVARWNRPDGTLTIRTDDPGLIVTVDGQLASWSMVEVPDGVQHVHNRSVTMGMKPGEHRVLALKDGRPFREEVVTLGAGEEKVVEFLTARSPPEADKARLAEAVAARTRARDIARQRFEEGLTDRLALLAAEVELDEARIALAEAGADRQAVVARLQELIEHRQAERDLISARVQAGTAPADALDRARARLADAEARLAKARPRAGP